MAGGLTGGCACGQVRVGLEATPMSVHCCHCKDCQQQTGTAFVLNALFETTDVNEASRDVGPVTMPTDIGRPHRVSVWVGTPDEPAGLATRYSHLYATETALDRIAAGRPAADAYYDFDPQQGLAR